MDLRKRIWAEKTRTWFMPSPNADVPHNYDDSNIEAMDAIREYLQINGSILPSNWTPDSVFYENMKRCIGYCSAPQQTFNDVAPTQPLYMSFFPFVFELGSAAFLGKFDSYVTRPGFLEFGNTIVIRQDEPKVVQLCMNGIIERLFRFENPKYGFIHRVLINDDVKSNIAEMGFEDSGDFWLRFEERLKDGAVDDINNPHAFVTSDRSLRIQELRTYLASADSFVKLDIENHDGDTYLQFRQKSYNEVKDRDRNEKSVSGNSDKREQAKLEGSLHHVVKNVSTVNSGNVIFDGTFTNSIVGDRAIQINNSDDRKK